MKEIKKEIKFVCEKCGKEPEKDIEKSNDNWAVFDYKPCMYCGGKLGIKVKS